MVNLAQLDSFDSGRQEALVIRYLYGPNAIALRRLLQSPNPPFNYLVLKKSGPHLIVSEKSPFVLRSTHESDISRHVLQPKPRKKTRRGSVFLLTVNRGNELYSKDSWKLQKESLATQGISCALTEGVMGKLECRVKNPALAAKQPRTPTIALRAKRFNVQRVHLVAIIL